MIAHPLHVVAACAVLTTGVLAGDLIVDAGGSSGYATINAAMAAAAPGDRILVLPGSYPAFQFSKGVHVHGMGDSPADVVVARVDYHVSLPTVGYDTSLTNMTLQTAGAAAGHLAITGNELPPGVFVGDGLIVHGGVYLAGGGDDGFAFLLSNSSVETSAGQGFLGSAVHVGGPKNTVEIVNSTIRGWDSDPDIGLPAGIGLRILGGTRARISNTRVHGGNGALGGSVVLESGAHAVVDGLWPQPVTLRVDGHSLITGGAGAGGGSGGHAVDVSGEVAVGVVSVWGGAGSPAGWAWADSLPATLPFDIHLAVTPHMADGSSPAFVETGDSVTFTLGTPAATSAILFAFDLGIPSASKFFTLSSTPVLVVSFGNTAGMIIPESPLMDAIPAVMLYAQGLARDGFGVLHLSQTTALRADLLPSPP